MMSAMEKFWVWLGVEKREEEIHEEIIEIAPKKQEKHEETSNKNSSNVVSIHTNKSMKIIVCEPESFDEVQALSSYLKNRKQVIANLEKTPPEISQRIIDFLSGATYSLEGQSQQIGKNIFLFTPSNIEVAKDHRSLIRRNSTATPAGSDV